MLSSEPLPFGCVMVVAVSSVPIFSAVNSLPNRKELSRFNIEDDGDAFSAVLRLSE